MTLTYITGATSTGKTTFADSIKGNATIISLDAFSKCIRFTFDNFKLYTDEISIRPTVNNNKFLHIVKSYIECFINDYPNTDLIVEGCHFTPDEFLSSFPNAKVIAIGITDSDLAFKQINKREWMSGLDEKSKKEYVRQIVEYSNQLKENQGKHKYIEFKEFTNEQRTDYRN